MDEAVAAAAAAPMLRCALSAYSSLALPALSYMCCRACACQQMRKKGGSDVGGAGREGPMDADMAQLLQVYLFI